MRPAILVLAFIGAVAAAAVPKDSIPSTSIAKGFKLPKDIPDGVYSVSYNTSGDAIHELMIGSAAIMEEKRAIEKRASDHGDKLLQKRWTEYGCPGYEMNHNECDIATFAMGNYGWNSISPGRNYYAKIGNSVAYMCNFGNSWATMDKPVLDAGWSEITRRCGWYQAGWTVDRTSEHWFTIGYEWSGANFCAQGYDKGWSVAGK